MLVEKLYQHLWMLNVLLFIKFMKYLNLILFIALLSLTLYIGITVVPDPIIQCMVNPVYKTVMSAFVVVAIYFWLICLNVELAFHIFFKGTK